MYRKRPIRLASAYAVFAYLCLGLACSSQGEAGTEAAKKEGTTMSMQVTSTAFAQGARIPTRHTCEGEDLSPPLAWSGVPENTKSFALICDDPDAPVGTWVHWVLFNIPPTDSALAEGIPGVGTLPNGAKHGINDFRRLGYGGPCPPRGHGRHRYFFKLYALDAEIDLTPGATKADVLSAMEGHVLAEAQLMGTYSRD